MIAGKNRFLQGARFRNPVKIPQIQRRFLHNQPYVPNFSIRDIQHLSTPAATWEERCAVSGREGFFLPAKWRLLNFFSQVILLLRDTIFSGAELAPTD